MWLAKCGREIEALEVLFEMRSLVITGIYNVFFLILQFGHYIFLDKIDNILYIYFHLSHFVN